MTATADPGDFGETRPPPASVPAEMALLGAILKGRAAWPEVAGKVEVADFYLATHRTIVRIIGTLADRGEPCDLVTVAEALEATGKLEDAQGLPYLGTLAAAAGAAANAPAYARAIRRAALARRLMALGGRLAAGPNGADVLTLMEQARSELDTLAEQAEGAGNGATRNPPGLVDWLGEDLTATAAERHRRIFERTPAPPPVLIEGLLPCDTFGLVGPGGVSKSTFALWMMIRVILGWDVFNRRVYRPGPCLYISAEDPRPVIEYRIRQLCDSMNLSPGNREVIARDLHIEDWTGLLRRFVEADATGNLIITPWVDGLVRKYREAGIRMATADPAVFFGAGERFVNDGEASLMQAGRRLATGFDGAAAGFIHHISQNAFREGITDQYASRGGTAFADNSRAQLVMQPHLADSTNYPRPLEITQADVDDGRAFRLHIAKFSAGKRDRQPLWILRGQADPWQFRGVEVAEDPREVAEIRQKAADARAVRLLWEFVRDHQGAAPQTARSLREAKPGGLAKHAAEVATAQALSLGYLAERDLPPEQRQGSRKTGLFTTDREPPIFRASAGQWHPETTPETTDENTGSTTGPPLKERDFGPVVGESLRSPNYGPLATPPGQFRASWGQLGQLDTEADEPPTDCAASNGAVPAQWRSGAPDTLTTEPGEFDL